jgi:mannose-6-phosphate isomerase-like protein (cupin superfamily)
MEKKSPAGPAPTQATFIKSFQQKVPSRGIDESWPTDKLAAMGFTIFQGDELEWEPRGGDDPRSRVQVSDALSQSRANFHRYPPGSVGRRHRDLGQEEVFVVLEGTATLHVGDPPERHEVRRGGVLVVESGTIMQLSNTGDEDVVLFIYGAPPVTGKAEFFESVAD